MNLNNQNKQKKKSSCSCIPVPPDPDPINTDPSESDAPQQLSASVIGESSTGKTSILLRQIQGIFEANPEANRIDTSDVDFPDAYGRPKTIKVFDTGGQVDLQSFPTFYLRDSKGIIIVCSYDKPDSIEALEKWHNLILEYSRVKKRTLAVVLNKSDLLDIPNKTNLRHSATEWARKHHAHFFETSAKEDPSSVNKVFEDVFTELVNARDDEDENNTHEEEDENNTHEEEDENNTNEKEDENNTNEKEE